MLVSFWQDKRCLSHLLQLIFCKKESLSLLFLTLLLKKTTFIFFLKHVLPNQFVLLFFLNVFRKASVNARAVQFPGTVNPETNKNENLIKSFITSSENIQKNVYGQDRTVSNN